MEVAFIVFLGDIKYFSKDPGKFFEWRSKFKLSGAAAGRSQLNTRKFSKKNTLYYYNTNKQGTAWECY